MQKLYACLISLLIWLPAVGVAQTFDTPSIHSAAMYMGVVLNIQKENRDKYGNTILRAQDFLYPDAAGSRPLRRTNEARLQTVLKASGTTLAAVAATMGEVVDDLETGGARLNEYFRQHLSEPEDVTTLLAGVMAEENYRGIRTGTAVAERDANLLTADFKLEPLRTFARMNQSAALQGLSVNRNEHGGNLALKVALAGGTSALAAVLLYQAGWTIPSAGFALSGGAALTYVCARVIRGFGAPPEANSRRFR